MADDDKQLEDMLAKGEKRREVQWERQTELEDILATIAFEPGKAAWAMEELFRDVIWNHEQHGEGHVFSEMTPEERTKDKQEWDAEMAAFWKRLDRLTGRVVGYPDRPEFNPD